MLENATLCRLCVAEGTETTAIYDSDTEPSIQSSLQMIISTLANVQIYPGDGLPNAVCVNCKKMLYDYHEFKLMVERSDMMLRNKLKESEVDPLSDVTVKSDIEDIAFKCEVQLEEGDSLSGKEEFTEQAIDSQVSVEEFRGEIAVCEVSNSLSFENGDNIERVEEDNLDSNSIFKSQGNSPITVENSVDLLCKQISNRGAKLVERFTDKVVLEFKCGICEKRLANKRNLERHKKMLHSAEADIFPCNLCDKRYTAQQTLNRHMETMHMIGSDIEKDFSCEKCKRKFPHRYALRNHELYSVCSGNKTVECEICHNSFSNCRTLQGHKRRIHSENMRRSICDICGKEVKFLPNHIRAVHSDKPATCNLCNTAYSNFSEMLKHKKSVHYVAKGCYCDTCGKKFNYKGILKIHMLTHTGVREFKCDLCGQSFGQKTTLITHQRVHTGFEPYQCNRCGLSFRWKGTFIKHESKCSEKETDDKE